MKRFGYELAFIPLPRGITNEKKGQGSRVDARVRNIFLYSF